MIVCICHNVSDKKIRAILLENECNIHNVKTLKQHIPICTQCGKCKDEIKCIIKEYVKNNCEE